MVARPLVAWLVQELHVHEKNVISVLVKVETVFSCFFFQMFVITQLRDNWYGHGVRTRS